MLQKLLRAFMPKARRRTAPARQDLFWDAPPDDAMWIGWRPATPQPRPSGMAILDNVHVHGTGHRRREASAYVRAAKRGDRRGEAIRLLLRREPANPHDRNAVQVLARLSSGETHIGYLPREFAACLALDWPADMPIGAQLSRIRTNMSEGYDAIHIDVLRPTKRSAWWKANMAADG